MYIDAHCHLEVGTYGEELDAVIDRAFAAGFSHLVAVGASRVADGADEAVALATRYPQIYATAGIHPHEAQQATEADVEKVARHLAHPKVVALGEVGLDFYYDNSPRARQRALLERFLGLACEHDIPVMLHIRDAHAEAMAALDAVGVPARGGVVHCFTAGVAEARGYLARGLHLSIPGVVTFKKAENLREAIQQVPSDRLLLETDCPYLAPVPYRGKRNEPAYMVATAAAVGALKGISGPEMGDLAAANTKRLFGLPD